jgi:4Fe-4S ferredoxin
VITFILIENKSVYITHNKNPFKINFKINVNNFLIKLLSKRVLLRFIFNFIGESMPKHIASGLKYLATVELKRKGFNQQKIANELDMDRSTVSHYLNGRNLSLESIDVAKTITQLEPKDFLILTQSLFKNDKKYKNDKNNKNTNKDGDIVQKIVSICKNGNFKAEVLDSCIGCGLCVDLCLMKAISLKSLKANINSIKCCGCLLCKEGCPTNSIKILEENNDREYERS